ncbi:MAG: DUF2726 domain-containing protein [Candidatus Accumulibacter sp.]|nr:DUF2726 domain-containing protein [Accumulibacter sp.]
MNFWQLWSRWQSHLSQARGLSLKQKDAKNSLTSLPPDYAVDHGNEHLFEPHHSHERALSPITAKRSSGCDTGASVPLTPESSSRTDARDSGRLIPTSFESKIHPPRISGNKNPGLPGFLLPKNSEKIFEWIAHMSTMLLFCAAVFLVLIIAGVVILRGRGQSTTTPYVAKESVLSQPEKILYHRLVEALPEYVVLAQVQLSRVLLIKGVRGGDYQSWLNKIDRMSLDYLLCRPDFAVVAAIELDDSSHDRKKNQLRDAKKNKALADAGIKLIRWHVRRMPDAVSIRQEFFPNG